MPEFGGSVIVEVLTEAVSVVEVSTPGPAGPAGDGGALEAHIEDTTPHPAYDDQPSLVLIFENGLV